MRKRMILYVSLSYSNSIILFTVFLKTDVELRSVEEGEVSGEDGEILSGSEEGEIIDDHEEEKAPTTEVL